MALCLLSPGKTSDVITAGDIGILHAELDVLKAGLDQPGQPIGVQSNAGSNQVPVKPDVGGMADELGKITSGERLTAREMHLQDAQACSFTEDAFPCRRVELG